jgi:hypothetical protein
MDCYTRIAIILTTTPEKFSFHSANAHRFQSVIRDILIADQEAPVGEYQLLRR